MGKGRAGMKTEIHLGKMQITSIQSNAGVFYGDNVIKGWRAQSKTNSALGRVNGDGNMIASRLNFLNDPDIADTVLKKSK